MKMDTQVLDERVILEAPRGPPAWTVVSGNGLCVRGRGAAVHDVACGDLRINALRVSPHEAGMFQLVLRVRSGAKVVRVVPLLGLRARAAAAPADGAVRWRVHDGALAVEVALVLDDAAARWAWLVRVANRGAEAVEWDVLYAQDLGLAPPATLRINEAYAAHYVDHTVLETAAGPVLLSRQNQPQAGERFPWMLQGCQPGAASYATDGLQVLGLGFRATGEPEAWRAAHLPSRVMQYEMGCGALVSMAQRLAAGDHGEARFFAEFVPHHPSASGGSDARRVAAAAQWAASTAWPGRPCVEGPPPEAGRFEGPLLAGEPLDEAALRARWGGPWRHEERRDGALLSFFTESGAHVVLGAKERRVERPHGHILVCGDPPGPEAEPLCSTVYAMGVFHSHVTRGNPNLHRLLSVVRHPLNLQRSSGLRLFVDWDGAWRQLGIPSAFGMHARAAEWVYRFGGITLEVRSSAAASRELTFTARVLEGPPLSMRATLELDVDGARPYRAMARGCGVLCCPLVTGEEASTAHPSYIVEGDAGAAAAGPADVWDHDADTPLLEWTWPTTASATLRIRAADDRPAPSREDRLDGTQPYRSALTGGVRVMGVAEAERLDTILPWFSHNALVHLATPHGLEQFNGGAWGTRDVCQGPLEWLIATGRTAYLPVLLDRVYAQQDADTGLWPQWFMFEPYGAIRQRHCHGDIVVWPLKALCDVLEATDDPGLLDRPVGWMGADHRPRPATPLRDHVERQLGILEHDCIEGTSLLRYRDGDWDDTLQPLRAEMRERMTSAWTVMLVFETVTRFAACARRYGWHGLAGRCADLAERIHTDVHRHLIRDGVIAGFALFGADGRARLLLHPSDHSSGPRLRLLSINRGILSGLFTPTEARAHLALLREWLWMPDGVHLMDTPVPYRGGRRTHFQRAETAAFFGREVGLQYVHAHLRYCEAMARVGDADELVRGLLAVNPVALQETVANAECRQANAYFSSSDARFDTRAEAAARWEELRAGGVPVRGGWRVYSSGPGIFVHAVLARLFGWRRRFDRLELDPVLPAAWDGVALRHELFGRPLLVLHRVQPGAGGLCARLNGEPLAMLPLAGNPYRAGGGSVAYAEFRSRLREEGNVLDLALPPGGAR